MTVIHLILAAAALIWGSAMLLRGSLVWGVLAFLVAVVCFGHDFAHFRLGMMMTCDRLIFLVLVAAYLIQRRLRMLQPKPWTGVDYLTLLLLAVLTTSTLHGGFAIGDGTSEHTTPGYRLLIGYLIPFMLFLIIRDVPLSERRLRAVYATLFGLGVYLAFTGIMEVTGNWWAVFPSFIGDSSLGVHYGRARGPMLQSVCYGLYLGIALLVTWLWGRTLSRSGRLAAALAAGLMLIGVFFSYTRSVWMGVMLSVPLMLALTLRGKWRGLVVGSMIAVGAIGVTANLDSIYGFEREQDSSIVRRSADSRKSFAYVSWLMFQERPVFGWGFGQFPIAKLPYLADRQTDLNLDAIRTDVHHNLPLSMLIDAGIIGLAAFIAALGSWFILALRLVRARGAPQWMRDHGVLMLGALVVFLTQSTFHETSYMAQANPLLFVLLGLTVNVYYLARNAETSTATAAQPILSQEARQGS